MKNLYVFNVNTRGAMYGIGTYIEQLAKCSIKKDMNVSIVEINASCEEFKVETKNGIRYIYIPWPSVYPSGLGFARLLTIIQNYIPFFLKEFVKQGDENIFHLNRMEFLQEGNKNLSIMDEDVENAIVEYLHINRDKKIAINWFGGEPLMGFARIVSISHKLKNLNIKFRSSIVTNGSLLDEDKINQLHVLNLNHLQISLDGLAHTHDKRRYFKMGKPSFDLIISNIENFLRLTDIHLYIQVTVDKTNSNAYEDIVKFFNEKFPTYMNEKRIEIGFNAVQNRTDFERKSDCFNQEEVFLKNKIRLSQTKRKNLSSILPGIVPSCMYRNPTSFAIDPSGDMFKCLEHLGNSEYKVGNIKEKSVSLSKMAQATFGLDPFEDEECLACNVFPICGGGCPLDRQKKKMGKSINYCSIYKTRLADMLPALYECYEQ